MFRFLLCFLPSGCVELQQLTEEAQLELSAASLGPQLLWSLRGEEQHGETKGELCLMEVFEQTKAVGIRTLQSI